MKITQKEINKFMDINKNMNLDAFEKLTKLQLIKYMYWLQYYETQINNIKKDKLYKADEILNSLYSYYKIDK